MLSLGCEVDGDGIIPTTTINTTTTTTTTTTTVIDSNALMVNTGDVDDDGEGGRFLLVAERWPCSSKGSDGGSRRWGCLW